MPETRARFLSNLIGATSTDNDFTLPDTAVSGTNDKVLTSGGDGTVTWETTELPPATTSISPTEVASDAGGNITFTLTGANYGLSGMTVHFIATSGNDITSGMTVTHGTATSLTVEIARSAFLDANEPYSVKVTKASGLNHTLSDAIRVDNAPSFTASANTVVATVQEGASNDTHATIVAIDAEGDTITFSEVGTTLYDEFTSATPRGVQSDGTIKGVPDAVTTESQETTFTVRATSTGDGGATTKTTDQAFKFVITPPPLLFSGKTYTGNGTSQSLTFAETYSDNSTARNLTPDLVWLKCRTNANNHALFDSVRGTTKRLDSNRTNAEYTSSGGVTSFNNNGFSIGNSGDINTSGRTYIAWAWKAGGEPSGVNKSANGTATEDTLTGHATNTGANIYDSDKIASMSRSVNVAGGFSICKITNGSSASASIGVPHGLGVKPDLVIWKSLADNNWNAWHKDATGNTNLNNAFLLLNSTAAENTTSVPSNGVASDSNYYYTPNNSSWHINAADREWVMYSFVGKAGVSAFGSYTGTGGTLSVTDQSGATNCGFNPRWLMIKRLTTHSSYGNSPWVMFDNFRDTGTLDAYLQANDSAIEATSSSFQVNFQNNGFEYSSGGNGWWVNDSDGATYIYMAFA